MPARGGEGNRPCRTDAPKIEPVASVCAKRRVPEANRAVLAAGLAQGLQSSLDTQLQAALTYFNAGDKADGVSQLVAFINHVSAQRGKGIAADLADAWIADAQDIINAVG